MQYGAGMTLTSKQLIDSWTDYDVIESWFLSPISPIAYVMILEGEVVPSSRGDGNHILIRMTEGEEDLTILHIGVESECYAMAKRAYGLELPEVDSIDSTITWTTTAAFGPRIKTT
jgi:hypothetical protein